MRGLQTKKGCVPFPVRDKTSFRKGWFDVGCACAASLASSCGRRLLAVALLFRVEHSLPAQSTAGLLACHPSPSATVYTPAHATAMDAVREFFGYRSTPVQPIAYTHKVHLANGLQCINCHVGVDQGPDARIPSVNFCMTLPSGDRHGQAGDQETGGVPGARRRYSVAARVRLPTVGPREIQSRAAYSRRRGLLHVPRRYDESDGRRTHRESHDGLLRELPPAAEGADRLCYVPFLDVSLCNDAIF